MNPATYIRQQRDGPFLTEKMEPVTEFRDQLESIYDQIMADAPDGYNLIDFIVTIEDGALRGIVNYRIGDRDHRQKRF